jgi:curved DNA-binding protein CbpA
MHDFYSVLGLPRGANHEEIKAAYWRLAKRSHPDVNAGDKQAELRTKEINRAYETLGDPDARAAYDLELQLLHRRARRSFWSAAATGAATFILTIGFLYLMVVWKQRADIHPSPSSEIALSTRNAGNKDLAKLPADRVEPPTQLARADRSPVVSEPVKKPPADDRAELPAQSADKSPAPSEPGRAAVPQPSEEPPRLASAAMRKREVETPGAPAARPSAMLDRSPDEELANELTGTVQVPEASRVPPASPASEYVPVSPPEVGLKSPMSTTLATSGRPREDRKPTALSRIHEKLKKYSYRAENARATMRSRSQGSERGSRQVSSSPMALRFPSADEPYVNLGVRNR